MQRKRPRFEAPASTREILAPAEHALKETRTLVLVATVMLGFQFRTGFEPGLKSLPPIYEELRLGAIGMTMVAIGLLAFPATYHRLVSRRRDPGGIRGVASASIARAMVPFALSLGLDVTIAGAAIAGATVGWSLGGGALVLALLLWYGLRIGSGPAPASTAGGRFAGIALTPRTMASTALDRKMDHVLSEVRLVLPGAQALFGLQLSVALMQGFATLAAPARLAYLMSLGLMALAIVLLLTPVAFHRIVERGKSTDRAHRVAGVFLVSGMAALALALSGDVYVAASRVARFTDLAAAAAAGTALFLYSLWFAVPLLRRRALPPVSEPRFERG